MCKGSYKMRNYLRFALKPAIILVTLISVIGIVACSPTSPYPETMWTQNIYPSVTGIYDLGSGTYIWDDLYVENVNQTGYIDISSIAVPANPATHTLRLYAEDIKGFPFFSFRDSTGMVRKIVRDSVFVGKNITGVTILKGRAVYASGSEDNVPTIALARADSVNTMPCIGVTTEAIDDGDYGRVMQVGLMENINTNAFSEGDVIYVHPTTAGAGTNIPPSFPYYRQEIGTVLVKDAAVGTFQCVARSMEIAPLLDFDNFPLILDDFSNWGEAYVGSGAHADAPVRITLYTGIVANSSALKYCETAPVRYGGAPASINWSKKLVFIFSMVRINNDAEFVGRIQIKNGVGLGALADDGLGIQVDNFNLTGETYGALGRGTVALTTVLTSASCYGVMIVHTPGVKTEFFIDSGGGWVLEGTQTDTTLIPTGMGGGWNYVVASGQNGVTGGVNDEMSLYKPYVLSYR